MRSLLAFLVGSMLKITVTGSESDGVPALASFVYFALTRHAGLDDVPISIEGPQKPTTRFGMGRLVQDAIHIESKPDTE